MNVFDQDVQQFMITWFFVSTTIGALASLIALASHASWYKVLCTGALAFVTAMMVGGTWVQAGRPDPASPSAPSSPANSQPSTTGMTTSTNQLRPTTAGTMSPRQPYHDPNNTDHRCRRPECPEFGGVVSLGFTLQVLHVVRTRPE